MSRKDEAVYIIPGDGNAGEGKEAWITPEPAEEVIVEEVLTVTDLSRETVQPLSDHVEFAALEKTLSGERGESLTFEVEGHTVTLTPDGTVTVDGGD